MIGPTTSAVVDLGLVALRFARVDRITLHDDGVTPESDTDHTVMLGLIGCAFAARHLPQLDVGLVAQFALVHDLVEVYAGDTPTMHELTPEQKQAKADREGNAEHMLAAQFGVVLPWVATTIRAYEERVRPEARYVKALDKLLPKITHVLNGCRTLDEQGMGRAELVARYDNQLVELQEYAADFPALFKLRAELVALVLEQLPDEQGGAG
jgi:putative hydrolase of HD superfamily